MSNTQSVLSPKAQAAVYTIALILVGIGALGAANTLTQYGIPPSLGIVFVFAGIIGASLEKGYSLNQAVQLRNLNKALLANKVSPPSTS